MKIFMTKHAKFVKERESNPPLETLILKQMEKEKKEKQKSRQK